MAGFEQESFAGERRSASSESHYIDTPEQVELRFNIAGLGSRFVAILLDHLFQVIAYLLVIVVLVVTLSGMTTKAASSMDSAGKWFIAILLFLHFALWVCYFALFEAYWHGQTPGKRIMKLRVIKDSGRQITLFEAMARNLLRIIDYMPGLYLAGVITMICNKANKRLGDFAAGTIVVHERRDEQPLLVQPSSFYSAPATPLEPWREPAVPQLFPADAVAKLGPQDLVVIEAFFARALDLTIEMRAMMAARIAQTMAAKMGAGLPEGNPERALESIAFAMRGSGRAGW